MMIESCANQRVYYKCPKCGKRPSLANSSYEIEQNKRLTTGSEYQYVTCICGETYLDP